MERETDRGKEGGMRDGKKERHSRSEKDRER